MELNKTEKILFILPLIALFDVISTLFSLSLGGREVGLIGSFLYERSGEVGLVAWSILMFFVFIVLIWSIILGLRYVYEQATKTNRAGLLLILFVTYNILFLVEAVWIGTVTRNFLVHFLPPLTLVSLQATAIVTYFILVNIFTRNEMRQFIMR